MSLFFSYLVYSLCMNIIYRVYEKGDGASGFWGNYDNILNQEVCICNDREQFKDIMRSMYGPDIAFRNSKKLPLGTPYIVIISENCYDAENYVSVMDYKCPCCDREFKAIPKMIIKFHNYELSDISRLCPELYLQRASELENMTFCCNACKEKKFNELKDEFKSYSDKNNLVPETFIDKNTFLSAYNSGYIYKMTKTNKILLINGCPTYFQTSI